MMVEDEKQREEMVVSEPGPERQQEDAMCGLLNPPAHKPFLGLPQTSSTHVLGAPDGRCVPERPEPTGRTQDDFTAGQGPCGGRHISCVYNQGSIGAQQACVAVTRFLLEKAVHGVTLCAPRWEEKAVKPNQHQTEHPARCRLGVLLAATECPARCHEEGWEKGENSFSTRCCATLWVLPTYRLRQQENVWGHEEGQTSSSQASPSENEL
ncbi:hypothetical protein CB1_000331036 [Camelus ferus]|nr:hypothetical protein CB1_000331036 [Camelus ferus]